MNDNRLKGALIGFCIGFMIGLQMCSSCRDNHISHAPIDYYFGVILGIICSITGALVANGKDNK